MNAPEDTALYTLRRRCERLERDLGAMRDARDSYRDALVELTEAVLPDEEPENLDLYLEHVWQWLDSHSDADSEGQNPAMRMAAWLRRTLENRDAELLRRSTELVKSGAARAGKAVLAAKAEREIARGLGELVGLSEAAGVCDARRERWRADWAGDPNPATAALAEARCREADACGESIREIVERRQQATQMEGPAAA